MSPHFRHCPGRLPAAPLPFATGRSLAFLLRYPMTNQAAGGAPRAPRNDRPARAAVACPGPACQPGWRNRFCES
jgi:hypothetical protein